MKVGFGGEVVAVSLLVVVPVVWGQKRERRRKETDDEITTKPSPIPRPPKR